MTTDLLLSMHKIHKAFSGVTVLNGVDMCIGMGEIHALLGENGAGKSTLLNILGGVLHADAGKVVLDGREVKMRTPSEAMCQGIGFIHQELNLVNDLTVAENIYLGRELTNRFGLLNTRAMMTGSRAILERLGYDLDPATPVRDLDISQKQIIEIARVLAENARLIIMDEPTTALTDAEITHLFALMRTLKQQGVSIIFVSHKLPEIFEICDRYTVLRNGEVAGGGAMRDVDEQTIIRLMIGNEMVSANYYHERPIGDEILQVRNLSLSPYYRNIDFSVRRGEIIGFTGLTGDGRNELFETLFGCRRAQQGSIEMQGKAVRPATPRQARELGIGLLPRNRKENAIIKDLSVLKNMTLVAPRHYCVAGMLARSLEQDCFVRNRQRLRINAAHAELPITSLSGGNQQKVVLAKWLEADIDIFIMDNPTQGIDIGAKSDIYQLIMDFAAEGKAVIVLSPDIPELLKICDRIYTMFHGEITHVFPHADAQESEIMTYVTGAKTA